MRAITLFSLVLCLAAPAANALTLLTEENPPLNFTVDGQLIGLSPGVVTEMAKRAGLPSEIRVMPWKEAFERARTEPGACVFSTVRTPERFAQFEWIGPIARGFWSAFSLPDAPVRISKLDELSAYRVGVVNDARAAYMKQRGIGRVVLFDRDADIPSRLTTDPKAEGGIDVWVTQGLLAGRVAAAAGVPRVKDVFSALMSQDYFLACSKATPPGDIKALSDALSGMRRDGSLRRVSDEAIVVLRNLR